MKTSIVLSVSLITCACNSAIIESGSIDRKKTDITLEENSASEDTGEVSEPIPVAGAFLSCSFPEEISMSEDNFALSCSLLDVEEEVSSSTASFYFENDANKTPIDFNETSPLTWELNISGSNLKSSSIVGSIAINDGFTFEYVATPTINSTVFSIDDSFWLGGEPNNVTNVNPDGEDCLLFFSAANKEMHAITTGNVSGENGRFNDDSCLANHSFLCRSSTAEARTKWQVVNELGPFSMGASICPEGYHFSAPFGLEELLEVKDVIDASGAERAWMNLSDKDLEGTFVQD